MLRTQKPRSLGQESATPLPHKSHNHTTWPCSEPTIRSITSEQITAPKAHRPPKPLYTTSSPKARSLFQMAPAALPGAVAAPAVHSGRIRVLEEGSPSVLLPGPVVYWMFRDQRSRDNWALIHAADLAARRGAPLAVAFNLFPRFLGAHARQLGFMLRGLRQVQAALLDLGIPFFLFRGQAVDTIPRFVRECGAAVLVTDFSPLREPRVWKQEICAVLKDSGVAVHEVDAHNVVPLWSASPKLEYGAKTIRGKIHRLLPDYLVEFPQLTTPATAWSGLAPPEIDWDGLIEEVLRDAAGVPEVVWCEPGEAAAMEMLMGEKDGFLTKRLNGYATDRNNPIKSRALSCLSPYLHFGHISAQRCAVEARALKKSHPQAVDAFLEELIVRRELADNFCYYQPHYDSIQGAWDWARKTLTDHASDKREHVYTKQELETAKTADPLWNAAQLEMVHHGKMHGFMSMNWMAGIQMAMWAVCGPYVGYMIRVGRSDRYLERYVT